jgi:hypothetical protein
MRPRMHYSAAEAMGGPHGPDKEAEDWGIVYNLHLLPWKVSWHIRNGERVHL